MSASETSENLGTNHLFLWAVLAVVGIVWGTTGPLSKVAVSTGNHPIGITFWSTAIAAMLFLTIIRIKRHPLPFSRRHIGFYVVCGLLGTALPNSVSYETYRHLPVGVVVIGLCLVPMMTLLLSWLTGQEKPAMKRIAGLVFGFGAVLMIMLPDTSLPDPEQAVWVLLMVVVALSYAGENVFIAVATPSGCDALTTMTGLTLGALALLAPLMVIPGVWVDMFRLESAEQAILAVTVLHMIAYFGFVWLIARAGPVFAAQVSYVVTTTGVVLGILFFDEQPSAWIWGAMALMFVGLALVKPSDKRRTQT